MAKKTIEIRDFALFAESMKALSKVVNSAKFIISDVGLSTYGVAPDRIARSELETTSIYSKKPIEFAIEDLQMFNKIISTVKDAHDGDFTSLVFCYEQPFIKFESKKVKLKCHSISEDKIEQWISKKVTTQMTSVFDFTTTPAYIKNVNGHSFLFSDPKSIKVYIETRPDMDTNVVYATIGNREVESGNEATLKFGIVNYGAIPEGRNIIIDPQRLALLNMASIPEIKVSLMDYNCLVTNFAFEGKNNASSHINIYCTMFKQ